MREDFINRIITKSKPEKRYTLQDLRIRYDRKNDRICIFIIKKEKEKKQDYSVEYEEEKIDDGYILAYTKKSVGHCKTSTTFRNILDEDRYRGYYSIYGNTNSLIQLFGESFEGKSFSLEQLKDLEEQINEREKSAYYRKLYTLNLSDSYTGKAKQLCNDLHIAEKYRLVVDEVRNQDNKVIYKIPKYICIEKDLLEIEVDEEKSLIIKYNGRFIDSIPNEYWKLENFSIDIIDKFSYSTPFSVFENFRGFSRQALKTILEKYKEKTHY